MVIGTARASLIAAKGFKFTISSDQVNANLRTLANNAGYSGGGDVEATINTGVNCYASNTSNYGLNIGTFPSGTIVTLINKGFISGAGGNGSNAWTEGNPSSPTAAQAGGTALYTNNTGFTVKLNNSAGTIRGGGGGGGWGADGYNSAGDNSPNSPTDGRVSGGGGGGGQGTVGGAGGVGGSYAGANGVNGSAGSSSGAGAGGAAIQNNNFIYGGAGGNGGSWGAAGASGTLAPTPQYFYAACPPDYYPIATNFGAGSGGAGGYSIVGYSKITVISIGTLQGGTSG